MELLIERPCRLDIRQHASSLFAKIVSDYKNTLKAKGISASNELAMVKGLKRGFAMLEDNTISIDDIEGRLDNIISRADKVGMMSCKRLYTRTLHEKLFHVKQLIMSRRHITQEAIAIALIEIGIENIIS